jgi:hypothetical protein
LLQQQQQQQQRCYRSHLSSGSVFFFCCKNRDVFSVLIVATYSPVVKLSFCSLLFLEVLVLVAIGQQQEENGRKRVDITLNKTTEKPQNKNRCVCVAAAAHDDDPVVNNNDAAVVVDDAVLIVVVHLLCVGACNKKTPLLAQFAKPGGEFASSLLFFLSLLTKNYFSHNLRNPVDN